VRTPEASVSKHDRFISRCVELGADDAKIISPQNVVTAEWVRWKCQYGCGGYGKRLTCPPYSPRPEETRRMLDEYGTAILIHCSESSGHIKEIIPTIEREAFLAGFYRAFGMGSGPCRLCDRCDLRNCKHPSGARPSMEACGIDVFSTARSAGYPIEVVRDRDCAQNYYGLLLLD
jgi:predicted metal-binding protein